jgi:hypothetical protein
VLGYDTDLVGEMEVSAFELRTRPRTTMVWLLCIAGALLGLAVAPRRTVRAWRSARGWRNLYACPVPHAEVLTWSIDEMRSWMSRAQ